MIKINNRIISEKTRPYIIAELSANHNGSYIKAKSLIKKIAKSGVDAVKLQTFLPEEMTLKSRKKILLSEIANLFGRVTISTHFMKRLKQTLNGIRLYLMSQKINLQFLVQSLMKILLNF